MNSSIRYLLLISFFSTICFSHITNNNKHKERRIDDKKILNVWNNEDKKIKSPNLKNQLDGLKKEYSIEKRSLKEQYEKMIESLIQDHKQRRKDIIKNFKEDRKNNSNINNINNKRPPLNNKK